MFLPPFKSSVTSLLPSLLLSICNYTIALKAITPTLVSNIFFSIFSVVYLDSTSLII